MEHKRIKLTPGKPCGHPGCLSHVSHPCEGCGRVAGIERQPTQEEVQAQLQRIADNAVSIQKAANKLKNCIVSFELFITHDIVGPVETEVVSPANDFVLRVRRAKKEFKLFVATIVDHKAIDERPLVEAGILYKIAAVKLFPDVFDAMKHTHETRLKDINNAIAEFDAFMKEIAG